MNWTRTNCSKIISWNKKNRWLNWCFCDGSKIPVWLLPFDINYYCSLFKMQSTHLNLWIITSHSVIHPINRRIICALTSKKGRKKTHCLIAWAFESKKNCNRRSKQLKCVEIRFHRNENIHCSMVLYACIKTKIKIPHGNESVNFPSNDAKFHLFYLLASSIS